MAELLSSTFTITQASRKRTSEEKRPLVLRLMSIIVETDIPDSLGSSSPLTIEKYDPDSCSVTIYDPLKGIYSFPLSTLVSYNIISLKALICPKLIQQFCVLSIKPPISSNPSSFSIISLFDGSGSFTDVIANALNQWPHAILAAEMDADTRSVVSRVKGWPAQGSIWAFDKKGAHTFYAKDVWDLIKDSCLLLRQFLSLLPPDCIIFVGAGSPCQDLTSIGRGKGVLGLAGDRSVHIHCVWAVLYFLSLSPFWSRIVVLVENAGSMRPHMTSYILSLLGIPSSCSHYINCSRWGSVTRARYFFSSSDTAILPPHSPSPFNSGWFPMLKLSSASPPAFVPIPLPPWLRPRGYTPKGSVVQTPLAYHPKNLLFDSTYFGSWALFCESCLSHLSRQYPEVPFKQFLPEFLWKEWDALLEWRADFDSQLTQAILQTVTKLQEFYSNPYIYTPFRPLLMKKHGAQNLLISLKPRNTKLTLLFGLSTTSLVTSSNPVLS